MRTGFFPSIMDSRRLSVFSRCAFFVLLAGCAQVGSPDGGGRDEDPPVVVSASPSFGSTGWTGSLLELRFDEFVKVQDARSQVLVSPPLSQPPKVLVKGRSILVDLGEGLGPDRTYVVQFGNAIRDLRESNVAAGLLHVFSTGSELDSGRVAVGVVDAWTAEPSPGVRVMLFRDSLPNGLLNCALPDSLRPLPDYVGLIGDSGKVEIGFLPQGRFAVVALEDLNGNYRADAGEPLAWWTKPISVADTTGLTPVLSLDAPPVSPATYLSGVRVDSSGFWRAKLEGWSDLKAGPDGWLEGELDVAIAGPLDTIEVYIEGDSLWAELTDFQPELPPGTWQLIHPAGLDSLRFREVENVSAPAVAERGESALNAGEKWSVRFAPVPDLLNTELCSGLVIVEGDSMELETSLLSLHLNRLKFGPSMPGSRCELELLPGAVGRRGKANGDTLRFRWSTKKADDAGSILLLGDAVFDPEATLSLFVLTDASGDPLYDTGMDDKGRFSGLDPGLYGLVAIEDLDGNGRWTGVNPEAMEKAEPVTVLSTGIEVRAGWEVELILPVLPRP